MARSCINHVAHALIEDVIDPDWTDLRNVLNVARIAVEATDLYRDLYGHRIDDFEWSLS
jgi:hypothetical protein